MMTPGSEREVVRLQSVKAEPEGFLWWYDESLRFPVRLWGSAVRSVWRR